MDKIKITDNTDEMIEIGKSIFEEKHDLYDSRMLDLLMAELNKYVPNESDIIKMRYLYQSIYDYWVYGASIKQFFFYRFSEKNHSQKSEYMTQRNRFPYMYFLNNRSDRNILEDKYEAYKRLEKYYKRDVIQITSHDDYPLFCDFIKRHNEFIAKPQGLGCAIGVKKISVKDGDDTEDIFYSLLNFGKTMKDEYQHWKHVSINSGIVLEEIIKEDEQVSVIHPHSLNVFRITTVSVGDTVHFFYPRISIGNNKEFITNASTGALVACINEKSGIIETNGFSEFLTEYEFHPITNVKIKGFKIPKWDEMKAMLTEAALTLPTIRYVGWDLALSDKGWCIIEGNFYGEFTSQVAYNKGCRREFENLIGWKYEKDFWWEY